MDSSSLGDPFDLRLRLIFLGSSGGLVSPWDDPVFASVVDDERSRGGREQADGSVVTAVSSAGGDFTTAAGLPSLVLVRSRSLRLDLVLRVVVMVAMVCCSLKLEQ